MTQRRKALEGCTTHLAKQISSQFHILLKKRGYNGKMVLDHHKKQLTMEVKVEQSGKSAMTKDMKALSGGERSFTTVCFILALWTTIDSPTRMLDEFDVFMDMVNRRVSMAMLLKEAKSMYTKQHIFLTPQDISHHIGDVDICIHRLSDPERENQPEDN